MSKNKSGDVLMNKLENVWRIAQTGETQEPQTSPVENIMQMQNKSGWDKAKDFAGSVAGRNLLGGLGTAAAVALTGGDFKDALGYGVIGAGQTMDTQNKKRQYANILAEKQQNRADKIRQSQENRNFQLQMFDKKLQAQKSLADFEFENTLRKLALENQFAEQKAQAEKAAALEEKQNQYATGRQWLENADFDDATKKQLLQNYDAGYYGVTLPAEKKYASGDVGLAQMAMDNGKTFDEAMDTLGHIPAAQKLENSKQLYGWQKDVDNEYANQQLNAKAQIAEQKAQADWNRSENAAVAQAQRDKDFAAFKNALPTTEMLNTQNQAAMLQDAGYDVSAGDIVKQRYDAEQMQKEKQQLEIEAARQKMQTAPSDPVEEYRRKKEIDLAMQQRLQAQKEKAEEAQNYKTMAIMEPRVKQAIARARVALDESTGLGQFGGWGWTTGQGGKNRAAIQTAQAQINTMMRGLLKEMGVGSTELNSAVEAAAYRYQIKQDMPIEQIRQIFDDFEQDYLNGSLLETTKAVAQKYIKAPQGDYSQVSDEDLLNF